MLEYQAQHSDQYVIGIRSPQTVSEDTDPNTLYFNFNSLEDWIRLEPLAGKICLIFFDWSTFKFVDWNQEHLKLIYALLKPGGKLYIDCCSRGGLMFSMNYLDGNPIGASCVDKKKLSKRTISWIKNSDPW